MKYILFLLLLPVFACNKDKNGGGVKVEMYLLKSYQMVSGKCQIDASTITLEDIPLVNNAEILTYSDDQYIYTVSATAVQKINALPGRTPFAVTVNKEVIFIGVYMPSFLSSTCVHSITMSTWLPNKIVMNLGYPYGLSTTIGDERNNPLLLAALRAQGKVR